MKESSNKVGQHIEKKESENIDRRGFLGKLGKAAVVGASIGAIGAKPFIGDKSSEAAAQIVGAQTGRAWDCYQWRISIATQNYKNSAGAIRHPTNLDESTYGNRIGSFTKGLPHDANGEVIPSAFEQMLFAFKSRQSSDFELIPMGGNRRLVNPQAGLAFDLEGADSQSMIVPPAPTFTSREIAAEIAENYWMALLRDVPFEDYQSNATANAAAADLTLFGNDFKGPKTQKGQVTTNLLFRGLTAGDKAGPLMSQFWYLPCNFGANEVSQRIRTVRGIADGGQNYMTDFNSWLAVQNGIAPTNNEIFDATPRYIRNGRDIGAWVHVDVLFQAYFQAFLAIKGALNVAYDSGNPYSNSLTQEGFGTFGAPHVATLLCEVATRALKAVWYQKWLIHRRLRPEAFAGRIHQTLHMGRNYPVHSEILNSISSQSRLGGFLTSGNAFLPQAFPEGSPMHPAYGAGHATVAGACVTILKAFFDESAIIPNPVVPDASGTTLIQYDGSENLTVGGELNKMASNVANGRNIAGVHWRSDSTASLKLGEAIAISILSDQQSCYNEQFNGFNLTKFDGTSVSV